MSDDIRNAEFYWQQNANLGDFRSILTHHRKSVTKSEDGKYHLTYSFVNAPYADLGSSYCTELFDYLYESEDDIEAIKRQEPPSDVREMSYISFDNFLKYIIDLNFNSNRLLKTNMLAKHLMPTYSYTPGFVDFVPWMKFNHFTESDFRQNETYICEKYVLWLSDNDLYPYGVYTDESRDFVSKHQCNIAERLEGKKAELTLVNGTVFDETKEKYHGAFKVIENETFLKFDETMDSDCSDILIYLTNIRFSCDYNFDVTALNNFSPSIDDDILVNKQVTLINRIGSVNCGLGYPSGQKDTNHQEKEILHAVGHAVGLTHIRDTYFNSDLSMLREKYDNCTSIMSHEEEPLCPYGLTGLDRAALDHLYP